jgi:hypothetical protein
MTYLKVAKNLSMPPSAITETFGMLAVRGAGKSNTAAVMAEGFAYLYQNPYLIPKSMPIDVSPEGFNTWRDSG